MNSINNANEINTLNENVDEINTLRKIERELAGGLHGVPFANHRVITRQHHGLTDHAYSISDLERNTAKLLICKVAQLCERHNNESSQEILESISAGVFFAGLPPWTGTEEAEEDIDAEREGAKEVASLTPKDIRARLFRPEDNGFPQISNFDLGGILYGINDLTQYLIEFCMDTQLT